MLLPPEVVLMTKSQKRRLFVSGLFFLAPTLLFWLSASAVLLFLSVVSLMGESSNVNIALGPLLGISAVNVFALACCFVFARRVECYAEFDTPLLVRVGLALTALIFVFVLFGGMFKGSVQLGFELAYLIPILGGPLIFVGITYKTLLELRSKSFWRN